MSDLQCPATFLVLGTGAADRPAPDLRHARLAAVYAVAPDAEVAARIAREAGLPLRWLQEPSGTTYPDGLADLADLHRGETVLVVLRPGAVSALAERGGLDPTRNRVIRVAVDADGWTVRPVEP
ncbi:MAG: hypothetical protein ACXWDI_10215 [Nocardioides sp.]